MRKDIQVFVKSSLPMTCLEESQWFNKALNDEACYHGTLFVSAAHRSLLAGTGDNLPEGCYRHKGEAIRIINQRLSDPHQRVEDGTIAAIACLAAYEVSTLLLYK
jgi:Fungal specific transcription factor domain